MLGFFIGLALRQQAGSAASSPPALGREAGGRLLLESGALLLLE